jgi:CRP-like cAMP-binding protein
VTITDAERVKRELLLRSLFPSMPVAAHVRFIELLEDVELATGELAFAQGDPPDRFLFLTEGRVIMEAEGQAPQEFSGFAVVGVIDAVLNRPRIRACRALEPSKALAIRTADWFDMLEDNAEVARAATRNFATRLYDRWHALAPKLARYSTPPPGRTPKAFENYDKILVLRQAAFLKRAGMQAVASLAAVAEPLTLAASASLFEANHEGQHFYVVGAGVIELSQATGFRITHSVGDLVGGPASFCNALPNYAARALTDAIVLRISEQDFYDQAEEHGRLVRGVLAFLVSELEAIQAVAEPPDDAAVRVSPRSALSPS